MFCFGYGKFGHGVKKCQDMSEDKRNLPEELFPYSVALKAESNVRGKEFRYSAGQKNLCQKCYVG